MIRCKHRLDRALRQNLAVTQGGNPVADRVKTIKIMRYHEYGQA